MSLIPRELRHAIRSWRRTPVVAAIAVLSLAIAIGANSALFSALDAMGLRPLGVPHEEELVRIGLAGQKRAEDNVAYGDYLDIRDGTRSFAGVAAWQMRGVAVSGRETPEVVGAIVVSGNYLPMLGVRPVAGRTISPSDDVESAGPTAMISEVYWRRRFGANTRIAGQTIVLNRVPCTIIGVVPTTFRGSRVFVSPDVWLPINTWPQLGGNRPDRSDRRERDYNLSARLRPGVGLEQARAEVDILAQQLADAHPEAEKGQRGFVQREREARAGGFVKVRLMALIVSALVLLVACANVAGLLLGRAEARRAEIAIRLALGASRGRLARELLLESALLSAAGCAGGLCVARWILSAIPSLVPPVAIPISLDLRLDARAFLFTLTAGALAVPVFGLVPALMAARRDVLPALQGGATGNPVSRRVALRDALVIGQVTVSVVLLIGAVLVAGALARAREIDPGFRRGSMLLVSLSPRVNGYSIPQARAYAGQLLERTAALPDVERVTIARRMPLSPMEGGATEAVSVQGYQAPDGAKVSRVAFNVVAPAFFDTMGTRLLRGRDFSRTDEGSPGVVIVSEAMARRFWPHGDAVGRQLTAGEGVAARSYEVVGIARDVRWISLNEAPRPLLYFHQGQRPSSGMTLIVRTSGHEAAVAPRIRAVLRELDPTMPMMQMLTLDEHMRFAMAGEQAAGVFSGSLGLAALLLASIGLYGVISYFVGRRARELGVRMALGATPNRIMRAVVGRGLTLASIGTACGLLASAAMTRALQGSLYGVNALAPAGVLLVVSTVVLVSLVASAVPARRAARLDPVHTLRAD
jgi:macrolide transport system ATP-binding/permease protein